MRPLDVCAKVPTYNNSVDEWDIVVTIKSDSSAPAFVFIGVGDEWRRVLAEDIIDAVQRCSR